VKAELKMVSEKSILLNVFENEPVSIPGKSSGDLVQRREKMAKTSKRRAAMTICRGIGILSTRHKIYCRTLSDEGDYILTILQMQLVNIDYFQKNI
jgi:hypothetical protein